MGFNSAFKGLNAELNPICHLLALSGAHHIPHVSGVRVNWCPLGKKKGIQRGAGGQDGVENAKEFTGQASILGSTKGYT